MNLDMIKSKNQAEDVLVSFTRNCETHIEPTHTRPKKTLEFKPGETFSFNPPISIEGSWMIGLTSLEVYNSNFKITEENNELELYTVSFDEFLFTALEDKLEEILNIADITLCHLQHEIIGPRNKQA